MQNLFTPLPAYIYKKLQELPDILHKVMPMHARHRKTLHLAIEELSVRLTSERALLRQPYWGTPRLTAAYLWYFLPWNILRLTRLLHGLDLPPPTPMPTKHDETVKPRILVDMGSGPLSLPLALWLAKPEWHSIPLTIVCSDTAAQPLQLGQKIFELLAGKHSPWRIVPRRCTVEATSHELHKIEGVVWLIAAANVCNELKTRPEQTMDERLFELVNKFSTHIYNVNDARLLFVEPGTRLGGKTIVSLREAGLECELHPVSPCPAHSLDCPLRDSKTWCHFTFDTGGAPAWLTDLSRQAHLRKEALSLAFVLLQNNEAAQAHQLTGRNQHEARIISAPFSVPGLAGQARYACTAQGLALLTQAAHIQQGALLNVFESQQKNSIDKKSGAFIVEHHERMPQNKFTQDIEDYHAQSRDYAVKKTFQKNPLPKKSISCNETPTKNKKDTLRKQTRKASKKSSKKFWE